MSLFASAASHTRPHPSKSSPTPHSTGQCLGINARSVASLASSSEIDQCQPTISCAISIKRIESSSRRVGSDSPSSSNAGSETSSDESNAAYADATPRKTLTDTKPSFASSRLLSNRTKPARFSHRSTVTSSERRTARRTVSSSRRPAEEAAAAAAAVFVVVSSRSPSKLPLQPPLQCPTNRSTAKRPPVVGEAEEKCGVMSQSVAQSAGRCGYHCLSLTFEPSH